jgi:choice-of-anchor B domain-containing protein
LIPLRPALLLSLVILWVLVFIPEVCAFQDEKSDNSVELTASKTGVRYEKCESGLAGIYPCSNVHLVSYLTLSELGAPSGIGLNDAWGWTDGKNGKRYVLVGREDGLAFVDVTRPEAPIYIGELPRTKTAQPHVWRDVKVDGDYAFIVADGSAGQHDYHGMQIFDLKHVQEFQGTPLTFSADALYSNFGAAHNIVINEESDRAYIVGARGAGEICGGGFHILDISKPLEPSFLGCFADVGTGRSRTGYTHDAQCVTYHGPDTFHAGREICVGSNETAISISDLTNAFSPIALSRGTYPSSGYIHQGWFTEDHRYFVQNDEMDERVNGGGTRTLIWDMLDLSDPVLVTEFRSDQASIDHNLYIKDGLAFQANYTSGLRVLDVRDPLNPAVLGYFDTTPENSSVTFSGVWTAYPFPDANLIAATSRGEGLFLLEPADLLGTRLYAPSASVEAGEVTLSWDVDGENNVQEYQIEWRSGNHPFEVLDRVVPPTFFERSHTYSYQFQVEEGAFDIRIKAVSMGGGTIVSEAVTVVSLNGSYLIAAPYPNPVSSLATSSLIAAQNQRVRASLYDSSGREVLSLLDEFLSGGVETELLIDTSSLAGGVYYLQVVGEHFQHAKQIVVAR